MKIRINDKSVEVPDGATLADALQSQGIATKGIATALNGAVIPQASHAATRLHNDDSIIIIKAFYGG